MALMINRKHVIEEILNSFYAIRHKMKGKAGSSGPRNPITHSQWFVLGIIEHCKKTNIKDISESLRMSSSAATQLVDGLVQNGYVMRQNNPKDRRSVQLELSPKGKKQITAMKEKRMKEMAILFEALSDSELTTYLRLLVKITAKSVKK